MTTNPTRVKIPAGDNRFPDVEKALVTVLDDMLTELDPPGYACVQPPANYNELIDQGVAIVTVQRSGGEADRINDHPNTFISVTTAYRSDSWDVMGWLRPKLHEFSGVVTNPDDTTAIITDIGDMRGPQRDPALSEDFRRVSQGFAVTTRRGR